MNNTLEEFNGLDAEAQTKYMQQAPLQEMSDSKEAGVCRESTDRENTR
jgi:hypothetical protein